MCCYLFVDLLTVVSIILSITLLQLVCEGQFDSNVALKEKLANSSSELHMQPIGYDRDGQRHWFFKVFVFLRYLLFVCLLVHFSISQDFFGDLRLYAEKEYDQFPTEEAVWCLLCR